MDIKNIVKDICETKSSERINYIINYLRENNIEFKIQEYSNGINIEVAKEGLDSSKKIIFMAHHDIISALFEGANDNTSSVAILLSLCKYLYFYNPKLTVNIVFNDKEELLGGLLNKNIPLDKLELILENTGSFQYFKKNINIKNEIIGVFILELSGIGDSLYFAEKSGNIDCDNKLNTFLKKIAENNIFKYLEIPILNSDMISIKALNYHGTVIGATPSCKNNELSYIWDKIHTSRDNYFSIQENSLDMVYNFLIKIIENAELLINL